VEKGQSGLKKTGVIRGKEGATKTLKDQMAKDGNDTLTGWSCGDKNKTGEKFQEKKRTGEKKAGAMG